MCVKLTNKQELLAESENREADDTSLTAFVNFQLYMWEPEGGLVKWHRLTRESEVITG